MGVFEWVKDFTGIWGPWMLDFYVQYAFWINLPVVVYGALLMLSWRNLSRISDGLVDQIIAQAEIRKKNTRMASKKEVINLNEFELSWEEAYKNNNFPFIARQSGLVFHRSTLENIQLLITDSDLIRRSTRRLSKLGFNLIRIKSR